MNELVSPPGGLLRPGAALKTFRTDRGLTLAQVSEKTGLPVSTLSKVENGKMELTIDKLLRISLALDVNIADVFGEAESRLEAPQTSRRRSVTRIGEGQRVESPNGVWDYHAYDLLDKGITPIVGEIRARSLEEFGGFHSHRGEEFVLVLEGELAVYTDTYTPAYLKTGESMYFDSTMGHAYIAVGEAKCRILTVFSTPDSDHVDVVARHAPPPTPAGSGAPPARGRRAPPET